MLFGKHGVLITCWEYAHDILT